MRLNGLLKGKWVEFENVHTWLEELKPSEKKSSENFRAFSLLHKRECDVFFSSK